MIDEIKAYMIGVILFICIMVGGIFVMGGFLSSNPSLDSSQDIERFNNTFELSNQITTSVNGISSNIQDATTSDPGILGWINVFFNSAFRGLAAIGGTLNFMVVAAVEGSTMFGIPGFLIGLLTLIITVIIGFAIWAAITRN